MPTTDARLSAQRQSRLRADQSVRALRASLRRHCRRGTAGGTRARGADGLPAGDAVDSRGSGVRGSGSGHDRAVPLDTSRRPLARRHDPFGNGSGRRHHRRRRRAAHLRDHPRGARACRGECPQEQPVGHLHGVLHHSDRSDHGNLRALRTSGRIGEMSILGAALLLVALLYGKTVSETPALAQVFTLSAPTLALLIVGYGFVASVLPVWLLLAPRDYLSTFLKVGTVALLAIGVLIARPELQMPAITKFIDGSGPVWSGSLFPFLFITIAS